MFLRLKISWMLRLATLVVLLVACGGPSTTIEQSWRAPEARIGNMRNVVTLYLSRDGAMRRSVEDEMARKLARTGIRATPAYSILSDGDLEDRDRAKAKLVDSGFDGVIAIRLVSKETELEYVPSFDHYWGPAWSMAYGPGDVYAETVVRIETSAFSLVDNQLAWTALSRTVDPDNPRETIDEVTTIAARELEKQGVIARGQPGPG